jgi:hypothetical protein
MNILMFLDEKVTSSFFMDLDSLQLNSDCRMNSAVWSALYIFYLFSELLIVTLRSQSNGLDLTNCSAVIPLQLHWIQVHIL